MKTAKIKLLRLERQKLLREFDSTKDWNKKIKIWGILARIEDSIKLKTRYEKAQSFDSSMVSFTR